MHEKYQNLKLYWLIYLDKHHGISNAKLYEGYNKYNFAIVVVVVTVLLSV